MDQIQAKPFLTRPLVQIEPQFQNQNFQGCAEDHNDGSRICFNVQFPAVVFWWFEQAPILVASAHTNKRLEQITAGHRVQISCACSSGQVCGQSMCFSGLFVVFWGLKRTTQTVPLVYQKRGAHKDFARWNGANDGPLLYVQCTSFKINDINGFLAQKQRTHWPVPDSSNFWETSSSPLRTMMPHPKNDPDPRNMPGAPIPFIPGPEMDWVVDNGLHHCFQMWED